jgi:hypothetical protein
LPKALTKNAIHEYRSWRRDIPPHEWPSDDIITKRLHNYWAVPSDGRVGLGFTKEVIGRADDWEERVKEVEQFVADLAKIGAEFHIVDDGLNYTRCHFQLPSRAEDPQTLIRKVECEGLYERPTDNTQHNQEVYALLPLRVSAMIERLVASVESVGARPRWVNSIAPWRRTM